MATTKKSKLERINEKIQARLDTLIKNDAAAQEYLKMIESAKDTELSQTSRIELKKFDLNWINDLSKGLEAIERIVNNPKRFIKSEGNVVPIELAKKINGESVIHLSQNTRFVQKVNDDGTVIPSQILTVRNEDDFAIYENRFVKTLIDRLILFMEKRYEFIEKYSDTKDSDVLIMKSKSVVNGASIEYETKIKISIPSNDGGNKEVNQHLLNRIRMMRDKIRFYATCPFMDLLKGTKPVATPILKTNIILKNPDYNRCYKLWQFIDSYDKIGFNIDVKETNAAFSSQYIDRLYKMMMMSTLTLDSSKRDEIDFTTNKVKTYRKKPRIKKFFIDYDEEKMEYEQVMTLLNGDGTLNITKEDYEASLKRQKLLEEKLAKEKAIALEKEKEQMRKEKARLEKERKAMLEKKKKEEQLAKIKAHQEELKRQKALELERKRAEDRRRQLERQIAQEELERIKRARQNVVIIAKKEKSEDNEQETSKVS